MSNSEYDMKIIQIIPAEGWWAFFEDGEEVVKMPVVCFALFSTGAIEPIVCDEGCMRQVHGMDGFLEIDREDGPLGYPNLGRD